MEVFHFGSKSDGSTAVWKVIFKFRCRTFLKIKSFGKGGKCFIRTVGLYDEQVPFCYWGAIELMRAENRA